MDINNFSDDDLKQLMIKYKEKQSRYELIYNEATQRNERIILNIHLEQQRRWRKTNTDAFTRAKERNELYLSVGGLSRSTVLNGSITNAIGWDNTKDKDTLRKNRVNFFVNYLPPFLGQDLVGATTGVSTAVTVDERVGPARLKMSITNDSTNIALKYLYFVNNATTRSNLTSEITIYLEKYNQYLDTTKTQIICDSTNNIDNAQALNITIIVKPILSADSFTINVNLVS